MIFVALLFPCPCPFPLAKRCLNTFISPFHWLFLDRIGDLYTFKGFVHQLPHTKSWKPCSGIGNILSYSVIDVVRMLAIANIVAPRWHHLRSRRYLPWAPQAQLANSLAVIYHLTCAPSNSSVSYCPGVRRYAKLLTGIAFKNWLTQGPIYSRNKRQVFYFKGGWLATMSKKRLN
jgi:hypothetical protein